MSATEDKQDIILTNTVNLPRSSSCHDHGNLPPTQPASPQRPAKQRSQDKPHHKPSISVVPPPDGGWGWVVVLSSFTISMLVDGVCFSAGIFFNPFRDYYGSTKGETAWVGSVLNGTYLSAGPLVSAFCNKWGCRRVAMFGSLFASFAFFISTFSPTMPVLIVTYGFLGGMGFGFSYLPAIVMVGYYFEKRRALATGIACCGSGIGAFIFAPISDILLEHYGWKGATWILSGFVLNGLIFCIFYRPLELPKPQMYAVKDSENSDEQRKPLLGEDVVTLQTVPEDALKTDLVKESAVEVRPSKTVSGNAPSNAVKMDSEVTKVSDANNSAENVASDNNAVESNVSEKKNSEKIASEKNATEKKPSEKSGLISADIRDMIQTVTPQFPVKSPDGSKVFMSDYHLQETNTITRMAVSQDAISSTRKKDSQSSVGASKRISQQHSSSHHQHRSLSDPDHALQRSDIFYGGSLDHLPEFQSSFNIEDYREKVSKTSEADKMDGDLKAKDKKGEDSSSIKGKRGAWAYVRWKILDPVLSMFDFSLLKSPTFVIYGLSCFFCMLGFFVPFIYLPTLCMDLGISRTRAAYLISIIGIANTVGRVVVGFVSDQPWADCLLINNVALIVGGVATCLVPMLEAFALFAVYTLVFGTSIAIFVSLRSIIMVELMGLQKLTNAFGLVVLCQGISSYIGAPIAGFLADSTGDYNVSFYASGIVMAVAGIICLPLRRVAKWENAKSDHSLGEVKVTEL